MAGKKRFQYQVVTVTWHDAVHHSGVTEEGVVIHAPVMAYTTGWLLRNDEKGVSVALEYSDDGTWQEETFIPQGMIKSIKIYK